jgi:transcription termination factor Rho
LIIADGTAIGQLRQARRRDKAVVPACALVLAAVAVRFANGEHGLLRPLLEFAVLLRRILNPMGTIDGIEFLLGKLRETPKGNATFFESMNT